MNRGNKNARGEVVLHGGAGVPFRATTARGEPTPEQLHLLTGLWPRDEEMPEPVPPKRDCSSWMSPHWKRRKERVALWVLGH